MASNKFNIDIDNQPLFLLEHLYEDECGEHVKTIGLFTTRMEAETVQSLLMNKPGFVVTQDGFMLTEIYLNQPNWLEGFGLD